MSDLATITLPVSYLLASAAISAIAIWLIQSSRIASQVRKFGAISRENARIAQELHDGLLQGFLGLAWQVEAAAKQLPAHPQEAKEQISEVLTRMDSVLGEARQSIWDLQWKSLKPVQLTEVLKQKAKQNFESQRIQYPIEAFGPPCELIPEVAHSLGFIIREAWVNARQHAGPSEVRTEIHYGCSEFLLTVSDNGKGMNLGNEARVAGKWGVAGMRQRALKIHAKLTISSRPGAGTTIEIRMDPANAYASVPARSKFTSLFCVSRWRAWNREQ
jgi:signal transduction histidine kinase